MPDPYRPNPLTGRENSERTRSGQIVDRDGHARLSRFAGNDRSDDTAGTRRIRVHLHSTGDSISVLVRQSNNYRSVGRIRVRHEFRRIGLSAPGRTGLRL